MRENLKILGFIAIFGVIGVLIGNMLYSLKTMTMPTAGMLIGIALAISIVLTFVFLPKGALRSGGKASSKALGAVFKYTTPKVQRSIGHTISGFQKNPVFYSGIISLVAAVMMMLVALTTDNLLARYMMLLLFGVSIAAFITYYDKWVAIGAFFRSVVRPFLVTHKVAIWSIASVVAFVWAITSGGSWFVIILSGVSAVASLIIFFNWEKQALDLLWKGLVFSAKLIYKVLSGGKGADMAAFGWFAVLLAVTFLSPFAVETKKLTLMLTMLLFLISAILFFKNRVVK